MAEIFHTEARKALFPENEKPRVRFGSADILDAYLPKTFECYGVSAETAQDQRRSRRSIRLIHQHDAGNGHAHEHATATAVDEKVWRKKVTPLEKGYRLALGTIEAIGAGVLYTLCALSHGFGLPDDPFHYLAIPLGADALRNISSIWRGYTTNKPYRFWKDRVPYTGEGYPGAPVTYARENLRGFYKTGPFGWLKQSVSAGVVGIAAITHPIRGAFHQTLDWITETEKWSVKKFGPFVGRVLAWPLISIPAIPIAAIIGLCRGLARYVQEWKDGGILKKEPKFET